MANRASPQGIGGVSPPDKKKMDDVSLSVLDAVWIRRNSDLRTETFWEGVVEYLGPVDFSDGDDWVGIRLTGTFEGLGKNNGTVKGRSYFEAPTNCGLFVRLSSGVLSKRTLTKREEIRLRRDLGLGSPTSTSAAVPHGSSPSPTAKAATPATTRTVATTPTTTPPSRKVFFSSAKKQPQPQEAATNIASPSSGNNNNVRFNGTSNAAVTTRVTTTSTTTTTPRRLVPAAATAQVTPTVTTTTSPRRRITSPSAAVQNNIGNHRASTTEEQAPPSKMMGRCQGFMTLLFSWTSILPLLAVGAVLVYKPSLLLHHGDNDEDDDSGSEKHEYAFMTLLAGGLLLGQALVHVFLLLPLTGDSCCCCCCSSSKLGIRPFSVYTSRMASLGTAWISLVLLSLTFWSLHEQFQHNHHGGDDDNNNTTMIADTDDGTNDNDSDDNDNDNSTPFGWTNDTYVALLAVSATSLTLSTLSLVISFLSCRSGAHNEEEGQDEDNEHDDLHMPLLTPPRSGNRNRSGRVVVESV